MSNRSRLRRSAILGALACALLAPSTSAAAAAVAPCRVQLGAGLPSVPCDPGIVSQHKAGVGAAQAQAQERYYASYGEPESIIAPVAPAPADGTPWLTLAVAFAFALAAASLFVMHRRRLRLRRRVARAAT